MLFVLWFYDVITHDVRKIVLLACNVGARPNNAEN